MNSNTKPEVRTQTIPVGIMLSKYGRHVDGGNMGEKKNRRRYSPLVSLRNALVGKFIRMKDLADVILNTGAEIVDEARSEVTIFYHGRKYTILYMEHIGGMAYIYSVKKYK